MDGGTHTYRATRLERLVHVYYTYMDAVATYKEGELLQRFVRTTNYKVLLAQWCGSRNV